MYETPQFKLPGWIFYILIMALIVGVAFVIALAWQNYEQKSAMSVEESNLSQAKEKSDESSTAENSIKTTSYLSEIKDIEPSKYIVREEYTYALPEKETRPEAEEFENVLFIGGSLTESVDDYLQPLYGGISVVASGDLTLENALEFDGFTNRRGENITLLTAVQEYKSADKVYIMLGADDLGLTDDYFKTYYKELVAGIRKELPKAEIYLQSLMPINDDIVNQRMNERNLLIMDVAQESGVHFIDVGVVLLDEKGNFIEEAAPNGKDFTGEYYFKWFDYIMKHTA